VEDLNATIAEALADRYIVEDTIGKGGMATGYRARESHPPRLVATKVWTSFLNVDPMRDSIRDDGRFQGILKQIGLAPSSSKGSATPKI
jgi:hypothetical protein